MYASHFNWLQVSFRRTSLSSTGFESRKGERFPRAQGRRYLPVSASILLYFESLILNPTLRFVNGIAVFRKPGRQQDPCKPLPWVTSRDPLIFRSLSRSFPYVCIKPLSLLGLQRACPIAA